MTATQAPTPGPLSVGDYAVRLEDHPLVKAGEVHRVTEMFRGGYLGFARPVGGEWNPSGWRKCDADGWMPWSGGENPVPGRMVEVKIRWRNGEPSEGLVLSDKMAWPHRQAGHGEGGDIIAFRLAPTAPVEASGSEREHWSVLSDLHTIKGWLHGLSTAPDLTDVVADGCVSVGDCYQQEAREFAGRLGRVIEALRPQPSGETREDRLSAALIAMVYHFDRVDAAPEDKAAIQAACGVWAGVKRDKALSARPPALGGQS